MQHPQSTPDNDAIALLPLFERLGLDRITLVTTGAPARAASSRPPTMVTGPTKEKTARGERAARRTRDRMACFAGPAGLPTATS
jgi:hypothetical protein